MCSVKHKPALAKPPLLPYRSWRALNWRQRGRKRILAPDGSVWCPTDASGIIRATPDGQLSSLQPLEKDLRSNNVDRIRISGQQDIWAACDAYPADLYPDWNNNSGFSRYNDGPWDDFYWLDILPGNHKAPYNSKGLALDQAGHPWVASFHGISGYDGAQWIQYPVPGGDTAYINSIATDPSDGRVWAGGIGKIYRLIFVAKQGVHDCRRSGLKRQLLPQLFRNGYLTLGRDGGHIDCQRTDSNH